MSYNFAHARTINPPPLWYIQSLLFRAVWYWDAYGGITEGCIFGTAVDSRVGQCNFFEDSDILSIHV